MGTRTLQAPPIRLLAGIAIALALGASVYGVSQLDATHAIAPAVHASVAALQAETEAATVAESFSAAFNVVDYREPDTWLRSLQPLTTEHEFKMLKAVYVPMSWPLFERDGLVVSSDQVIVADQGPRAQGRDWQIRLVEVTVSESSQASGSTSLRMHVLLVRADGTWKAASLLSEEEVQQLLEVDQGRAR